jgi:undecaprenyl-diphosphatase
LRILFLAFIAIATMPLAQAGGGPLGIDHRIGFDESGIWKRSNQNLVQHLTLITIVGGSLWEGGETRLGRTFWRSLDSSAIGVASSTVAKAVFSRARPTEGNDPNQWFKGHGHQSFPSGEVTFVSAAVTPFVLEYGKDRPAVYALALLPAYDAIARMKSQAHWQTDVLAGLALGTAAGYYAHKRDGPFFLGIMPHGVVVGLKKSF